ncbi:MAG: GNAT family N-acetyltransferase [Acetobacteraceae bacterium]|nr:GNAT family N-acetyltransferase [Acetobacteraceae bacterium]
MSSRVRVASIVDAALLTAIHRAAFGPAEAWSVDAIGMQLLSPGGFALVHAADGMIMARVAADEAEILTLAVVPQARREGVGRALLAAAMAGLGQAGAVSLFLEVGVRNHAARALYAATGFVPVGTRRRYYEDGSDAQVMRASLPAPAP